jgi:hypothetical protein
MSFCDFPGAGGCPIAAASPVSASGCGVHATPSKKQSSFECLFVDGFVDSWVDSFVDGFVGSWVVIELVSALEMPKVTGERPGAELMPSKDTIRIGKCKLRGPCFGSALT